jgi:hypothetical protein
MMESILPFVDIFPHAHSLPCERMVREQYLVHAAHPGRREYALFLVPFPP